MSEDIAINVENLAKVYKLYKSPLDRLKEALSPIRRKYHHDFYALNGVSFEVNKGETVGIIGRNGSGKSTLLKMITGVLSPSRGSITVNGRISALLELGAGFNPEMTGIENVYFNGMLIGVSREEMDNKLASILAFADIGDFVYQPVKSYSSGMFVRLAFAVAVCVEPEILIVDEALSVGDIAFQQKCFDRLNSLKEKGVTILLVTHDIMLTRNYCDRVVYLQNGVVSMVADAETAGEEYIRDTRAEIQKIALSAKKVVPESNLTRFGTGEGEIVSVAVEAAGNGLPACVEGDLLFVRIFAKIITTILNPVIHVQVRDFRGYVLYGICTQSDEFQRIENDDYFDLRATLSMRISLQPGEYSVTLSLNNAIGDKAQVILDKQVSAATFTVLPKIDGRVLNGVVDLNGVWEKGSKIIPVSLHGGIDVPVWGIHDIGNKNLEIEINNSDSPEILRALADISRKYFGFFNKTVSRSIEYPYVVNMIKGVAGMHILDIGAGVSPLPLYLAQNGATVTTIDNSQTIRQLNCITNEWNGWGFLDYGTLNHDISSYNKDIGAVDFSAEIFDCLYSVSVVEHMPAQSRREMWCRIGKWAKPFGRLILTLDLIPKTDLLWNYCDGKLVEQSDVHGDIESVQKELSLEGFVLEECKVLRLTTESMTDVALLSFIKSNERANNCVIKA